MATKTSKPTPVEDISTDTDVASAVTKLPELLDAVVLATGAKRAAAKPVIEAFLAAMADQIDKGNSLMLPPLGKLKLVKRNETNGAVTLKLRAGGNKNSAKKDLADDED